MSPSYVCRDLFLKLKESFGPVVSPFLKDFLPKPLGLHTRAREPKREHLRVPALQKTTKIQREEPREKEERMKMVAGEEKKSEILVGPGERAVQGRTKERKKKRKKKRREE